MKPRMFMNFLNFLVVSMMLLASFSYAQTDAQVTEAAPVAEATPVAPEQPMPIMPHQDMAAMLEVMANELSQENVAPETLKKIAEQLTQMANMHKQMPMMKMEMGKQDGMKGMGMMKCCKAMSGGQKMEQQDSMAGMMSMMPKGDDPNMMRLRGEMLKAMGEILIKYGQEATPPQAAPQAEQPATPSAHEHHQQ